MPYPQPGWGYGPSVTGLLGRIRDGVRWYVIALILALINAVAGAVFTGFVSGSFGSSFTSNTKSGALVSGSSAAVVALLLLVGLSQFILIIVAWATWRGGVRPLPAAAAAQGGGYLESAQTAEKNYSRAVWTFVILLLTIVVAAIAVAALIVGSIAHNCAPPAKNLTPCTGTTIVPVGTLLGAQLGIGLVTEVFQFLIYFFATTSLVAALRPLASTTEQERVDRGRFWVLVGAALLPLGLVGLGLGALGVVVPGLGFLSVVPAVLILYGMYQIYESYQVWAAAHPPTAMGGSGPIGGSGPMLYAPPPAAPYGPPHP